MKPLKVSGQHASANSRLRGMVLTPPRRCAAHWTQQLKIQDPLLYTSAQHQQLRVLALGCRAPRPPLLQMWPRQSSPCFQQASTQHKTRP